MVQFVEEKSTDLKDIDDILISNSESVGSIISDLENNGESISIKTEPLEKPTTNNSVSNEIESISENPNEVVLNPESQGKLIKKQAKMATKIYDFAQSASCKKLSGEPKRELFKLDKEDKDELTGLFESYLEITGKAFSPAIALLIFLVYATMTNLWLAYELRAKRKRDSLKTKTKLIEKKVELVSEKIEKPNQITDQNNDTVSTSFDNKKYPSKDENIVSRKIFKIDRKGYYEYDSNHVRQLAKDRFLIPTSDVLELIKKGLKNKEIIRELNLLNITQTDIEKK